MKEQVIEVLQQGLQDEMHAALQYIVLAGKYGDASVKQNFLGYASDELQHAQKLLTQLQQRKAAVPEINLSIEEMDDLYLYLIEYMAKEEAAVFYYEALEKLMQQPELERLCKEIRGEEQLHLRQIREIYQQIKDGQKHAE